jgi:hypothetical protein
MRAVEKIVAGDKISPEPRFRLAQKKSGSTLTHQHLQTSTPLNRQNGPWKQSAKEAVGGGQGTREEAAKWTTQEYGDSHWRARGRQQRQPVGAGCEACHGARYSCATEGNDLIYRCTCLY